MDRIARVLAGARYTERREPAASRGLARGAESAPSGPSANGFAIQRRLDGYDGALAGRSLRALGGPAASIAGARVRTAARSTSESVAFSRVAGWGRWITTTRTLDRAASAAPPASFIAPRSSSAAPACRARAGRRRRTPAVLGSMQARVAVAACSQPLPPGQCEVERLQRRTSVSRQGTSVRARSIAMVDARRLVAVRRLEPRNGLQDGGQSSDAGAEARSLNDVPVLNVVSGTSWIGCHLTLPSFSRVPW